MLRSKRSKFYLRFIIFLIMLMHDTKSLHDTRTIKSTMLTDNRGKSDISSLSTVSIFKAIKSNPRRAHSRTVVATTVDCTRDLCGASLRPYTPCTLGRERRMNCSLHGEMRQGHCSDIRDETKRTISNELDESMVPWLKEMASCVLAFLTRLHARPGSDKSRHSPTFNETRSHCRSMIVNTKLRRAVIIELYSSTRKLKMI